MAARKHEGAKKMLAGRITAHKKQLQMTENQIVKLKKYLEDLISGSAEFKNEKNDFFNKIEEQRAENWLSKEQLNARASVNSEAELQELVNEIDEKAKELERIEGENYKVNPATLEYFDQLGIYKELDRLLGTVSQQTSLIDG